MTRRTLLAAALLGLTSAGAQAQTSQILQFHARLSGAGEVLPGQTAAGGELRASYDRNGHILHYDITYHGLSGPPLAITFYGPGIPLTRTAVAIPVAPPLGAPVRGATPALNRAKAELLLDDRWMVSIRTRAYPGGEIWGEVTHRAP